MKNITFSADEKIIEQARDEARRRNITLNDAFREWIGEFAGIDSRKQRAMQTIRELQKTVKTEGPFPRDELNER